LKLCFCRFILALAIFILAIVWWPASWAKIVIIIASALLAIMALFYDTCCCRKGKEKTGETQPAASVKEEPKAEEPPKEEPPAEEKKE